MIWVLAGTRDAREIIRLLKKDGFNVIASAVTERGRRLAKKVGAREVASAMDGEGMVEFIRSKGIKAVVDATHPFAVDASKNSMYACTRLNVPYIRFERKPVDASGDGVYFVDDFREAGRKAAELGEVIFYAAGSNNISAFLIACRGKKVIARVLRDEKVVEHCLRIGLKMEEIIAGIPPYSKEENLEAFKKYGADVLVTKESGIEGGLMEKLSAARELRMAVVVVRRPEIHYPLAVDRHDEVVGWVRKISGKQL